MRLPCSASRGAYIFGPRAAGPLFCRCDLGLDSGAMTARGGLLERNVSKVKGSKTRLVLSPPMASLSSLLALGLFVRSKAEKLGSFSLCSFDFRCSCEFGSSLACDVIVVLTSQSLRRACLIVRSGFGASVSVLSPESK